MSRGNIRCAKCGKAMSADVCGCGHSKCYIALYWEGHHYQIRRYAADSLLLNFERARLQLDEIRQLIYRGEFKPFDYVTEKLKANRFDHKIYAWLKELEEGPDDDDDEKKRTEELANATLISYKSAVSTYLQPFFGAYNVRSINKGVLKSFMRSLPSTLKKSTRRKLLRILRAFFSWLLDNEIINALPPFPSVKGDDSIQKRPFDYQEQLGILDKFPAKHRDIFALGVETGRRIAELTVLKVKDVNIQSKEVTIRRTYSSGKIRETSKTGSTVVIPLSKKAFEVTERNMKDKLPESFLFINQDTGRNYHGCKLRDLWRQYSGYSGADRTLYVFFRHSMATQFAARPGMNEYILAQALGHKDTDSAKHYIKMAAENVRSLMETRDNIVEFKTSTKRIKDD